MQNLKRYDKLLDAEGREWEVISFHPAVGKRRDHVTILNEEIGNGYFVEVRYLMDHGFRVIREETEKGVREGQETR